MSIAEWIDRRATGTHGERVAFRFEGEVTTYADMARRVDAMAVGLVGDGVGPGDRVGFCGLNRLELFDALFACARLGAIFVPFNNRLTSAELAVQIADCVPTVLLTTDGFAPDAVVRDLDSRPYPVAAGPLPADHDHLDDPVLMVYTSGTTGVAKGAMLSQNAILHTVLNGVAQQRLTDADRIVAPLPTFHVGGLNIQTLPTLYAGGEVILQRRFDPGDVLRLVAEHRVTQTLLVPAMLRAVSSHPAFAATDLSSLVGINSGSSVVPAEVMAPFFERGVPIGQVYGTTETGPTAVVLGYHEAAAHVGSCGREAIHTALRIVGGAGADVTAGAPGELWLRGPHVFSGYWNAPEATEAAFADGGWFRTGDVGYRDGDGYVFIADRIRDVVITGGENVYPAEIEPVLAQHPAIVEVAVIARPDERWGEIPVAVIVPMSGSELSIEELRAWCNGRLARFKQPRAIAVVDELPRTALGKVKKHELRERLGT